MKNLIILLLVLLICGRYAGSVYALEPSEVLVIANSQVPGSEELARYYMNKRNIPSVNLLTLHTTDQETCSRKTYNQQIASPVRAFLKNRNSNIPIRVFVTIYGVPLRVEPPQLSGAEQAQFNRYLERKTNLKAAVQALPQEDSADAASLKQQLELTEKKITRMRKTDFGAAVDSELTLVKKQNYALNAWQPNPFYVGYKDLQLENSKDEVLLGSRIDAPTLAIAKRMIHDSLEAERNGLKGTSYFDARWPAKEDSNLSSYALYDQSIHLAAEQLKTSNLLPVVVNSKKALFQPGEAPDAALYCGWYSLSKYVDAFDWLRGAVGYHIASGECETLRAGPGQGWCKRMLEEGVAATIGPVAEPYIQAFPKPDLFFKFLTSGEETLVEAYFHSLPHLSWQMVLLGDPLYRPFKNAGD